MAYGFNEDRSKVKVHPADDVYTKAEVYNKTEVYPKTDVYTASETDTLLGAKANSSDVYAKNSDGTLNVGGTKAYLTFKTSNIATFAPPTGITECYVYDSSDDGWYHWIA